MRHTPPRGCRGCGGTALARVLDLGKMPAADDFPALDAPPTAAESGHPLAMDLCAACGLAQLAEDDTHTAEPRGVEPLALRHQAMDALDRVAASGWLGGRTVREFGSPHGGSWVPMLVERGFHQTDGPADVVIDSFGIMHEADQLQAFARRAAATAPDGVLLVQFHSLRAIVAQGQWNALRHGHFAYYSLTALRRLLDATGMSIATAWEFDLYGGTVLVAAVHAGISPDETVHALLESEAELADADTVRRLQRDADRQARALHTWLRRENARGHRVFAYGAASRAISLLHLAGVHRGLLTAVADASPAKQGRRMSGTDVPIIPPSELVAAQPDRVLLTLPDLLPEVSAQWPELEGRWVVDIPEPS